MIYLRFIFLPLFFLLCNGLSSQTALDLFKSAKSIRFSAPDSAEKIALKGLSMLDKQKETLQSTKFYNLLGNIYTAKGEIAKGDSVYKLALVFARQMNSDTMLSNIYNNMGQMYFEYSSYKTTDSLYQLALTHAIKSGLPEFIADTYNNLGSLNEYYKFNKKAIDYFALGIAQYQKIKSNKAESEIGVADILTNLGKVYFDEGKLDISATNYFSALKIFEKYKLWNKAAICCINITESFFEKADYKKAVDYCKLASSYNRLDYNKGNEANIYFLQGKIFQETNQLDSSELYFRKCIGEFISMKNTYALAAPYNSLATLYEKKNSYALAKEFLNKAIIINKEVEDFDGLAINYFNLATIAIKTGDINGAEKLNEESRKILNSEMNYSLYIEVYAQAAEIASLKKQYEKAYRFIQIHNVYKDSLRNEKNQKLQEELEAIYQNDKKQQQLQLASSEAEKQHLLLKTSEAESKRKSTFLFAAFFAGILMLILIVFIIRSNIHRRKTNEILLEKNNLIIRQKEKVEEQKEELTLKNIEIEEQNKEILDSINYAKRIQYALLAHEDLLRANLPQQFIMFQPKDIVSGDFYWATKKGNLFYLAVCDSTGHGVPGAFMSLLNISFLNEAINEKEITAPGEILNHVRNQLIHNLYEARVDGEGGRDGMDGILFCFDFSNNIIHYASANNCPIVIRNNEIIYLETDKMPIGLGEKKDSFNSYTFNYNSGDLFYLYTDGYADQFGGPKGKKFKYKQLDELLLSISGKSLDEQSAILNQRFHAWKGDLEQIDDVCVVGIAMA